MKNWYVIHVMSRKEQVVCQRIKDIIQENLYDECFVPMAEKIVKKQGIIKKSVVPLFPGYIFIISDKIDEIFINLKEVPYFTKLLGEGFTFIPIHYDEVKGFLDFLDNEKVMVASEGYVKGREVFIKKGPLKGQEGRIKKVDRHKRIAYIDLTLMNRVVTLHVPLNIVEKI